MYSSYLLVRWIILVSYHLFTKRLYVSLTVFKIIKNIKSLCVKLKISISVCYMVRAQRCKNKKVARDLPHHYSICNYIHVLYRDTDFKLIQQHLTKHFYFNSCWLPLILCFHNIHPKIVCQLDLPLNLL